MDPGFYPVEERLGKGLKQGQDAVTLVDVGGGMGHDLAAFASKNPRISGRLILQDRPSVIGQISDPNPKFEPTAHDFFTPQPVKGKSLLVESVRHFLTGPPNRRQGLPSSFGSP